MPLCAGGARCAALHLFRVGPRPAGWSSRLYRAYHLVKRQGPFQVLTRRPENQSGHCRAIGCARRTHTSSSLLATLLLPEIVHTALLLPEIAHTADRTSVKYPTSPERRAPTIRVGACLLPRHGPHAEIAGSLLELREAFRSKRRPQRLTHASDIAWWAR